MSSHWLIWLPSQIGKNDARNKLQKTRKKSRRWCRPENLADRGSTVEVFPSLAPHPQMIIVPLKRVFFMSKNCCWAAPIVKTLDRKDFDVRKGIESGRSIRSILFQKLGRLRRPKCPIICHSYRHSLTVIRIANANTVVWKMKTCDHCGNKFQTR